MSWRCSEIFGTGKTHFIKGICRGLGVYEHVASPTFTIVNEYDARGIKICHFDCYRIQSEKELRDIGFDEYILQLQYLSH